MFTSHLSSNIKGRLGPSVEEKSPSPPIEMVPDDPASELGLNDSTPANEPSPGSVSNESSLGSSLDGPIYENSKERTSSSESKLTLGGNRLSSSFLCLDDEGLWVDPNSLIFTPTMMK